jgi:hypothetical protein
MFTTAGPVGLSERAGLVLPLRIVRESQHVANHFDRERVVAYIIVAP